MNNNNNQPPPGPVVGMEPPPPAAAEVEPPALANDDTQWRITWTAPDEEPEICHRNGFRRVWAVAVAVARMENDADDDEEEDEDCWDITSREAIWQLFAADAAVASAVIATHPDGRTITLTRL